MIDILFSSCEIKLGRMWQDLTDSGNGLVPSGSKPLSESMWTKLYGIPSKWPMSYSRKLTLSEALTHWGRVTHIHVSKLTIIGSDNGFTPERRRAIIWTNAGILLIGPLGTNFSEILIEIQAISWTKIRLKMSSAKCCSIRLGLNVLTIGPTVLGN